MITLMTCANNLNLRGCSTHMLWTRSRPKISIWPTWRGKHFRHASNG